MNLASVLMAAFGCTLYSIGVIMQKKGLGWMQLRKKVNGRFVLLFSIWLLGILLSYVLSVVPAGIASKTLPPYIVSAVNGWSIVVVVFLSSYFLKEKLYVTDIINAIVIVACILLMSRLQGDTGNLVANKKYLTFLFWAPFVLLVPVFFKFTNRKQKTVLLAVFSGFLCGLIVVFLNILVKESGSSLSQIASSPILYIYFAAGLASMVAKQAAYKLGDVILITPLEMSFSMIYPLLCTYLIYRVKVHPFQIFAVVFIIAACWGIQRKR